MKTIMIIALSFFWSFTLMAEEIPSGHYKAHEITTTIEGTVYKGTILEPTETAVKYVVIISPNIAGVTPLEWTMGAYFSQNGYMVLMTHLFESELSAPNPDTIKADNDYNKFTTGSRALLNILVEQFKIPQDMPVFGMGSSQGAISSIMIASVEPRIKAIWTAVGGGDLPEIYAHSLVPQVMKFRKNHMRVLGIKDIEEYETYLRANLKNDPGISCKSITVPFHQTIAMYDEMVPTKTQEFLVDQCPPHSVKRVMKDHIGGAATVITDRDDIKEFFESAI